jgi:hypothetical protein
MYIINEDLFINVAKTQRIIKYSISCSVLDLIWLARSVQASVRGLYIHVDVALGVIRGFMFPSSLRKSSLGIYDPAFLIS